MPKLNAASRTHSLFKIILILVPVLFFILFEFSLSVFWDGSHSVDLFVEDPYAPAYYTVNQTAGKRYFSGATFGSFGTQDVFLKQKPENGFRLFVLGGSTTAGYPYLFSGSFPAMLRSRLEMMYPEKTIEIVNLGMTAVNSFTVRDFALECIDYQPDAFILYTGHNEFYGALGSASTQGKLFRGNLHFTRFIIALRKLNIYRFMQESLMKALPKTTGKSQTLMARMVGNKSISLSDPLYAKTIRNFVENITDVVQVASQYDIPVIIGSLASNLRDQKPFVSLLPDSVDTNDYSKALNRVKATMIANDFTSSLIQLDTLIHQAPQHALSYFYSGRCYEFSGEFGMAYTSYQKAKDFDGLRFRASSDLNRSVQNICTQYNNAYLTPIEERLHTLSPNGLTGKTFFLEHLHPNIQGYFTMAKIFAETLQNIFSSARELGAPDETYLKNAIGVTLLDSALAGMRIDMLTSGWPFNNSGRFLTVDQIVPKNNIEALSLAVLKKESNYEKAHVLLAKTYEDEKKWNWAVKEYETLAQTFRNNESPLIAATKILIKQRQFDRALPLLIRTINLIDDGFSYKWAGTILLNNGKVGAALPYLQKAGQLLPRDQQLLYNLSGAYFLAGDTTRAKTTLQSILKINPDNDEAGRFLQQINKAHKDS